MGKEREGEEEDRGGREWEGREGGGRRIGEGGKVTKCVTGSSNILLKCLMSRMSSLGYICTSGCTPKIAFGVQPFNGLSYI